MHRPRALLLPLVLSLPTVGCGEQEPPTPSGSVAVPQVSGAFFSWSGSADLRGSRALPVDNPALWLPQPVITGEGWGPPGRGWHPSGGRSTLRFWRRTSAGSSLELDLTHRSRAPQEEFQISVSLNGRQLGTMATTPGRLRHRFSVLPGLLAEVNDLDLSIRPPVKLVEGPPHLSLLGVGIADDGVASAEDTSGFEMTDSGGIAIERSGVFVIPLDIPSDAERVEIRVRNYTEDPATLRLFLQRDTGERVDLIADELRDTQWRRLSVSMEAFRGERVTAVWHLDLGGKPGRLELGEMNFILGAGGARPEEPIPNRMQSATGRPDILLIVLDAARGDRFPGWDYPRQTLPVIDELGQSSLSFRYAFSECPTTSCSIPAMITGVPFLPGGQVGGGRQLANEVKTLAEYLAEIGYRTVGFSATPNNSASHNLDQGFEIFKELWGRESTNHGPMNMARLASDVIHDQPAREPLFLQLHFLPPHQPYDPGPEFDRFTDPDYSGPIRPRMSLERFSLGLESLEGEDLQHLIDLYDGNLSVADAAVGRVVEALKSAGRFDHTVIVITSDHGEAFMEHGRQGHNTTLFDEMLHVPLLLRLPRGETPGPVDLDRLASVLDIVPTVLGILGTAPEPEVGGLDLMRTGPEAPGPRTLFFRTSHPKNTMLAARTPKWKAISWPRLQVQMLFDVGADPAEKENLVGEQPYLYSGLGLRLREHLRQRTGPRFQGEEVEVTPEAREALRALGYLD